VPAWRAQSRYCTLFRSDTLYCSHVSPICNLISRLPIPPPQGSPFPPSTTLLLAPSTHFRRRRRRRRTFIHSFTSSICDHDILSLSSAPIFEEEVASPPVRDKPVSTTPRTTATLSLDDYIHFALLRSSTCSTQLTQIDQLDRTTQPFLHLYNPSSTYILEYYLSSR
jgi:hypothetical protein